MPFVNIQRWNSGCVQHSNANGVCQPLSALHMRTAYCLTTFLYNILKHTTCREEQNSIYGTNLPLWALIRFPQYSYWMLIVLCYEMALSGHTLGFIIITSRHIKRIQHLAIFNWNVGLWQVHSLAYTLEKPSGVSNFIQFGFNFQLFSHFYYSTVFYWPINLHIAHP